MKNQSNQKWKRTYNWYHTNTKDNKWLLWVTICSYAHKMGNLEEMDKLHFLSLWIIFCFINVYFYYFLDITYKWSCMIFVFLCLTSKIIKYLGVNLPKEATFLYSKNYDTDERNWREHRVGKRYCVLGLEGSVVLKWHTAQAFYGFSAIPMKLPMAFFTELVQKNFKFVWKH